MLGKRSQLEDVIDENEDWKYGLTVIWINDQKLKCWIETFAKIDQNFLYKFFVFIDFLKVPQKYFFRNIFVNNINYNFKNIIQCK